MNDINKREAVSTGSVARRSSPLVTAFFVAAAAASSVYCQTHFGPDPVSAVMSGWRLAITRPAAGSTSHSTAMFCYEITGTTREPSLVLEITPMRPGQGPAAATTRVNASVGRGSVTADLSAAGEGVFDVQVQLVVDDSKVDQPSVLIRGLTLSNSAPPGNCS